MKNKFIKLSKKASDYCEKIRGKNYQGCGSDKEFCKLCRDNIKTIEQFNTRNKKINTLVKYINL